MFEDELKQIERIIKGVLVIENGVSMPHVSKRVEKVLSDVYEKGRQAGIEKHAADNYPFN
jgi:hypothetical protein